MSLLEKLHSLFAKEPLKRRLDKEQNGQLAQCLTMLLLDIAAVDDSISYEEHELITKTLDEQFVITKDEIYALIAEAKETIERGENLDSYAHILTGITTAEERENIIAIVDTLVKSDGVSDQYELKLRHRYEQLLGVVVKPK